MTSEVIPFPGSVEAEIAADLLEQLERSLGYRPPIEQVDIEDEGDDCCAYIFWGRGDDEQAMLTFQRPEMAFDADVLEATMCTSKPVPIDPAKLAEEIRRAVKKLDPPQ